MVGIFPFTPTGNRPRSSAVSLPNLAVRAPRKMPSCWPTTRSITTSIGSIPTILWAARLSNPCSPFPRISLNFHARLSLLGKLAHDSLKARSMIRPTRTRNLTSSKSILNNCLRPSPSAGQDAILSRHPSGLRSSSTIRNQLDPHHSEAPAPYSYHPYIDSLTLQAAHAADAGSNSAQPPAARTAPSARPYTNSVQQNRYDRLAEAHAARETQPAAELVIAPMSDRVGRRGRSERWSPSLSSPPLSRSSLHRSSAHRTRRPHRGLLRMDAVRAAVSASLLQLRRRGDPWHALRACCPLHL